jgi:hypothetical protein
MKTLYIHIGTPKTGTSSIQRFLYINRDILKKFGYCYPVFTYRYPDVSRKRNAHFMAAKMYDSAGKRKLSSEQSELNEGLGQVAEIFQKFDNVIISDESIWQAFCSSHKNLMPCLMEESRRQGYRIKIIVYLRRQDQFLLSRWNQTVKYVSSNPLPWEEYSKKVLKKESYILDYADTLDRLADYVGKENIIVRRYDRNDWINSSLIEDFMNCIGLTVTEDYHPLEQNENLRLYGNAVEIKRVINSCSPLSKEDRIYLGNFLQEQAPDFRKRYPCCMMSPEEIEKFLSRYEDGNNRVSAEYIGDGRPLFTDKHKELPKWQADNPYMTEDVINFFSAVTVSLHRENAELRHELSVMRTQVNNLRSFREKIKHPFRTLFNKLFHRKK